MSTANTTTAQTTAAQTTPTRLAVIVERDVPIPMRDGVILYADIYRPEVGVHPVLLLRTPYNKEDAQTMNYAHPSWYAQHGYVVIVQDVRGRWKSEGEFEPYRNEAWDGYDTIEWAAALPDVIPKVGTYGFSYAGAAQWHAATARPPHLACMTPAMTGSDAYQGGVYRNGAFALACNQSWIMFLTQNTARRHGRPEWERELARGGSVIHGLYSTLPLQDMPLMNDEFAPFYQDWLQHPTRDEYWRALSIEERYDRIEVPVLHIGGWYDPFVDGTIRNYEGVRQQGSSEEARENQYLRITPWYHMPWSRYVSELDFGIEASNRVNEWQLTWFDRWLKGDEHALQSWNKICYFEMGSNQWKHTQTWPPTQVELTKYYLHGDRANSINGDGRLSQDTPSDDPQLADTYIYDPLIPVPALGGRSGAVPDLTPMGPKLQQANEVRNDVLVYTTEPLDRSVTVAGEVVARVYAATTAVNTDFVAKLIDVYPDGRAYNIAEGIVRTAYRHSLAHLEPVVPGEVVAYDISLGPTSIVFQQGHAIRLEITSSLFPTYDRNPNSMIPPGDVTISDLKLATQTIFRNTEYPSHFILPVVKG